jgi:SAM-dependent methyltransferase
MPRTPGTCGSDPHQGRHGLRDRPQTCHRDVLECASHLAARGAPAPATAAAPGEFTLVYLVFNTISNLLTQSEQVACFRNAARHLTPGGRFVIELWVPELRKLQPGQQATVWSYEPGYIGLDTYDVLRQRIVSHHFGFGEGTQAQLFRSPHRYIWPAELDLMAQLAGFELETRHADWAGAEFTAESRSHVSVYRLSTASAS